MGTVKTTYSKKNKTGKVSVITVNGKFRALNISGKLIIPSLLIHLNFQPIIKSVGKRFLGLFPFLEQKGNTHIDTYSIPDYKRKNKVPLNATVYYEYTFVISPAVDIPTREAVLTVLNRIEWLGDTLLEEIHKESISCSSLGP